MDIPLFFSIKKTKLRIGNIVNPSLDECKMMEHTYTNKYELNIIFYPLTRSLILSMSIMKMTFLK